MPKAKNQVIAGDFKGKYLTTNLKNDVIINYGFKEKIPLNKETIESYELVNDEHKTSSASGVARGLVGGALFGAAGMIAGAATAKTKDIYQIAIQFKSDDPKSIICGKRSLIEVDDTIYKIIMKNCF